MLVANAQDIVQGANERHEGASFFARRDRKAAAVLGNVDPTRLAASVVVMPSSHSNGGRRCCKVPNTRSIRPRASGL
jgi:hypothetical protein